MIINFTCAQILREIEVYRVSKHLPDALLNGTRHADDYIDCKQWFSKAEQLALDDMLSAYKLYKRLLLKQIRKDIKYEYHDVLRMLKTTAADSGIDSVKAKYRPGLNPVISLSYELEHIFKHYSAACPYFDMVISTVQNSHFFNATIANIDHDIDLIAKFFDHYMLQFHSLTPTPIELLHAQRLIQALSCARQTIYQANSWHPN